MATIRITDLRLRTIIGANEWERGVKQDVVINISIDYDAVSAINSDNLSHAVDYRALTKEITAKVESSNYELIEKLADMILQIVLKNDLVERAVVRVDKPQALRFADSVSVELNGSRDE